MECEMDDTTRHSFSGFIRWVCTFEELHKYCVGKLLFSSLPRAGDGIFCRNSSGTNYESILKY